jgi:glycosyltransferase involved in cell wall biosynthesis
MGPQDGVDYALRALAHLKAMGRDDVHAAFIGGGDAFDGLVRLTRELGLEDRVEFTGPVYDDEVLCRYLCTADVCLAPDPVSPLNDVSSMNKVVEYMALGRPMVSFDLRESRHSAGPAAVYASDNDERRFAELVAELLDDPERRGQMGRIGRERVEASLSWSTSRENLLAAYADALAAPRSGT